MTPAPARTALSAYEAAHGTSAFRVLEQAGYVVLGGSTRLDYLQRQTTNDMGLASPARAVPNVLTAPTGRIIETFTAILLDKTYALLTPPGRGPALAAYFQKRVFFNDQIEIQDQSGAWSQIEVHGPHALALLAGLGLDAAPSLNELRESHWQSHSLRVLGIVGLSAETGYLLIAPAAASEALLSALRAQQALPLDAESAEILRLEAGLAGSAELGGDYTPFEVGLDQRVSETKGCYTGQEVLARQVTYDKITRNLAVLESERSAEPGASVLADGRKVGTISSVAHSPRLGPLAMAVLRRPHHERGTTLTIRSDSFIAQARVR